MRKIPAGWPRFIFGVMLAAGTKNAKGATVLAKVLKFGALALLWLSLGVGPVLAQSQMILIQLNKVEPSGQGCQFHFVVENKSETTFKVFSADLVFFDPDGVLSSRSTVSFGKLRPNKTHLTSFVFPTLTCGAVGQVLVNELVECQTSPAREIDCLDAIELDYKGTVTLAK
jgi:hypothetical protein